MYVKKSLDIQGKKVIFYIFKQIMTNETEKCHDNLNKSAFCQPEISVGDFLNLNSLENHDEFCLAYTFTYREFAKSTLGLSWVGKPSGIVSFFGKLH